MAHRIMDCDEAFFVMPSKSKLSRHMSDSVALQSVPSLWDDVWLNSDMDKMMFAFCKQSESYCPVALLSIAWFCSRLMFHCWFSRISGFENFGVLGAISLSLFVCLPKDVASVFWWFWADPDTYLIFSETSWISEVWTSALADYVPLLKRIKMNSPDDLDGLLLEFSCCSSFIKLDESSILALVF